MKIKKSELNHAAHKYGSDKQYLEWLSYQPSCLSGEFNQYQDGVGRNIACHVRRANNSGTGIKPPYSAIPLTQRQHDFQHKFGEVALLLMFAAAGYISDNEAKEWFDNQAKIHLECWIESLG